MPTLAGNKHLSIHFFLHGPRLFHLSTEKGTGPIRRKWTSKCLFPRRHMNKNINTRSKIFPYRGKNSRIQWKDNLKYGKIKFIILKDSWLHATSIKSTVGNKLCSFLSPFHFSTSSRLTSAGAFRGDYLAACSTAFCSATEENESGGHVDLRYLSKLTQHKSTAYWLKFLWRHEIGSDGTRTQQTFTLLLGRVAAR